MIMLESTTAPVATAIPAMSATGSERFGLVAALAYARRLEEAAQGATAVIYAIGQAGMLDSVPLNPEFRECHNQALHLLAFVEREMKAALADEDGQHALCMAGFVPTSH
jgi:hypothetical protein